MKYKEMIENVINMLEKDKEIQTSKILKEVIKTSDTGIEGLNGKGGWEEGDSLFTYIINKEGELEIETWGMNYEATLSTETKNGRKRKIGNIAIPNDIDFSKDLEDEKIFGKFISGEEIGEPVYGEDLETFKVEYKKENNELKKIAPKLKKDSVILFKPEPLLNKEGKEFKGYYDKKTGKFILDENGEEILYNTYISDKQFVKEKYGVEVQKGTNTFASKLANEEVSDEEKIEQILSNSSFSIQVDEDIELTTNKGTGIAVKKGGYILIDKKAVNGEYSVRGIEEQIFNETYSSTVDEIKKIKEDFYRKKAKHDSKIKKKIKE